MAHPVKGTSDVKGDNKGVFTMVKGAVLGCQVKKDIYCGFLFESQIAWNLAGGEKKSKNLVIFAVMINSKTLPTTERREMRR